MMLSRRPLRPTFIRPVLVTALAGLALAGLLLPACRQESPPPTRTSPAAPNAATPADGRSAAPALQVPAAAKAAPTRPIGTPAGTFLDRHAEADLRLVSYNILWNNIFAEVSPRNADRFVRIMRALNPDIVALQEIGWRSFLANEGQAQRDWSAAEVAALMNIILPLPDGRSWHAYRGADNVTVARWPLKHTGMRTEPPGDREQALALVDLPDDRFPIDFYVMNNHYKCCDPEQFDARRQEQSDAIVAWIRDLQTPGGHVDLPARTALAVVGDLNIVGSFQPVATLVSGDIADESRYGPDHPTDWDGTGMTDAHPKHNVATEFDYTWRDDTSEYDPGRLDYVIYTDSVLEAVNAFVLNTTLMADEELAAAGLQRLDIVVDESGQEFDHLPLVVDFRVR